MADAKQTWFAVVEGWSGYALDAYPAERAAYRRELGNAIVGEFASPRAATDAVIDELRRRRAVWAMRQHPAAGRMH
jgi:hypothetical protein